MTWRVLGVATISLGGFFSWQAGIWSWLTPLLIPDYYYIMLLMIAPTSLVAQTVKRLSTMRETRVRSLGREDPLEKGMATHSSTLA